jgi:hypothetical protein
MPAHPDPARQKARAEGKKRYRGAPCVHGHEGERYTSSGTCVECQSASNARQDPVRQKANQARWKRENRERVNAYYRAWKTPTNPDAAEERWERLEDRLDDDGRELWWRRGALVPGS